MLWLFLPTVERPATLEMEHRVQETLYSGAVRGERPFAHSNRHSEKFDDFVEETVIEFKI